MNERPREVLVAVPDLFFATRIAETCKALGVAAIPVPTGRLAETAAQRGAALALVDLTAPGMVDEVGHLKSGRGSAIRVVGFYPHVEEATRLAAIAAGVDRVMPRSAFTRQLAGIIESGGPGPEPGEAADSPAARAGPAQADSAE